MYLHKVNNIIMNSIILNEASGDPRYLVFIDSKTNKNKFYKAYMNPNSDKIPSLPTLISMADYLNCNLDYLLDRTNNPMKVDEIDSLSKDKELSQLVHTLSSLDKNKLDLVNAYVQGLLK
jgi:hypothetical protein